MTVALVESGRSREGDARAAWALGPDFWPSLSQGVRATLLASRVRGLVDLDMTQKALEVADSAIEEARASGELSATTRALDARMYALMHMGDMSKAIAASVSLIEAAETTGDIVLATRGRINTGSVLNQLGMFEEAQTMLERALPDTRNRRMRILEASTLHNLGMSQARLGRLDDGITFERQAARIADECNAARLRLNSRMYEVVMLVWRGGPGDLGLALSTAQWLCTESRVHAGPLHDGDLRARRASSSPGASSACRARARPRRLNHRLESGPVEEWEEGTRLTLVEALLESGLEKEADRELDRAFAALVTRARGITIAEHRESFLKRNEEARTIIELASSRLGRALAADGGLRAAAHAAPANLTASQAAGTPHRLMRPSYRLRHVLAAAVLAASSLLVPTNASAAKIIVVDIRRAILDTEDGLRVQASLKRLFDVRQRELTQLELQFQTQQNALNQKAQAGTPQAQLAPQLQQLQQMYVELNQRKNDYTNEMAGREQQLTTPIYARILGLVKKIAIQQGADLIVDRTAAAYYKGDLEVTDRVIQMYNSGESTATGGPPIVTPPPATGKPATPVPVPAKPSTPNF